MKLKRQILIVGHRGFSGKFIENSLASFKAALDIGVDGIELDVWRCASGELVVFHDRWLARLTGAKEMVEDLSLEALNKLVLPNGEQIPTLIESLQIINRRCLVDIELKGAQTGEAVAKLLTKLIKESNWQLQDFIVTSFNYPELQKFHSLLPQVPIGVITAAVWLDYAKFAQDLGAAYLVIWIEQLSAELVADAHRRGLQVWTYTVNEPHEIDLAYKLEVDALISDYPDRLM